MWVKHTNSKQSTQMINFDRVSFISIEETSTECRFHVSAHCDNASILLYLGNLAECEMYMEDINKCINDPRRTMYVLDKI